MSAERALRPAGAAEDIPVTWADQQNINAFGRLHTRMLDIDEELTVKKTEYENVKDAANDIENLLDDDCCKIKIGEIFFEVSNDEAIEFSNKVSQERQNEYNELLKEKVRSLSLSVHSLFYCSASLMYSYTHVFFNSLLSLPGKHSK